jgi:signal peptidase II
MKAKSILRILVILMILSLTIGCDQVSKNIVREKIGYNEYIGFLNNHLTLTKIENTGAFLSLGQSFPKPVNLVLLIIFPLIVLGSALYYLFTKSDLSNMMMLAISFVVGGGAGNLFDRIFHGSVTDFLHIDFIIFQTGIFNLADVSIMFGMFIMLYEAFINQKRINYKTTDI